MYFIVIMAFALVLSDNLPPSTTNLIKGDPLATAVWIPTIMVAWSAFYVPLLVAWLARRRIRMAQRQPECTEDAVISRLSYWNLIIIFTLGLSFAIAMLATPWVRLVKDLPSQIPPGVLGLGRFPLIGDLVVLSPFIAGLVGIWVIFYPVELRIKSQAMIPADDNKLESVWEPQVSLTTYLIDKCRHQFLLVAAPMLLIVLAKHYTSLLNESLNHKYPHIMRLGLPFSLGDAALGIVSFLVLLSSPVLLRYIWSTQPLPPGPLRERFERICRRIGLRYREILLWRTHGMAVNAAVMGFVPPLRYILISDALVETMSDEEIEAVFGHEAGHVHHWHLPFFGVFAIVSMYIAGGVFLVLRHGYSNLFRDQALLQLVSLAVLMAMWLFGFGWLSRRFERQADLFGVRCMTPDIKTCVAGCPVHGEKPAPGLCVSAASHFGRTLIKIAELNGIPREAPSWRHGSIDSRCQLLERFSNNASALSQFDRSLTRIKAAMLCIAIIGTIVTAILSVLGSFAFHR